MDWPRRSFSKQVNLSLKFHGGHTTYDQNFCTSDHDARVSRKRACFMIDVNVSRRLPRARLIAISVETRGTASSLKKSLQGCWRSGSTPNSQHSSQIPCQHFVNIQFTKDQSCCLIQSSTLPRSIGMPSCAHQRQTPRVRGSYLHLWGEPPWDHPVLRIQTPPYNQKSLSIPPQGIQEPLDCPGLGVSALGSPLFCSKDR